MNKNTFSDKDRAKYKKTLEENRQLRSELSKLKKVIKKYDINKTKSTNKRIKRRDIKVEATIKEEIEQDQNDQGQEEINIELYNHQGLCPKCGTEFKVIAFNRSDRKIYLCPKCKHRQSTKNSDQSE